MTPEQPSVEAQIATVRSYIESHQRIVDGPDETFTRELAPSASPALAALDSLTAALKEAQDEAELKRIETHHANAKRNDMEARAQKAEAERDAAMDRFDRFVKSTAVEINERLAVVEAARVILKLADEERDQLSSEVSKYLGPWCDLVEAVHKVDEPPTGEGSVT